MQEAERLCTITSRHLCYASPHVWCAERAHAGNGQHSDLRWLPCTGDIQRTRLVAGTLSWDLMWANIYFWDVQLTPV